MKTLANFSFLIRSSGEREDRLASLMEGIHGQRLVKYEIIVAGDTKLKEGVHGFTLLPMVNESRKCHFGRMLNALATRAKYDISCFVDDDSTIDPLWAKSVASLHPDSFDLTPMGLRQVYTNTKVEIRWFDWALLDRSSWFPYRKMWQSKADSYTYIGTGALLKRTGFRHLWPDHICMHEDWMYTHLAWKRGDRVITFPELESAMVYHYLDRRGRFKPDFDFGDGVYRDQGAVITEYLGDDSWMKETKDDRNFNRCVNLQ